MGTTSLLKLAPRSPKSEQESPSLPQTVFFHETATPQERARAFREWAESHASVKEVILDDRRETLYEYRD